MGELAPKRERIRAAVAREQGRLYRILDDDPETAVAEARKLKSGPDLSEANVASVRASVFIDAGNRLFAASVVSEGMALLRKIDQGDPRCDHNIANGLAALARIQNDGTPGQMRTAGQRQEARALFQRAGENGDDPSVRSSALTNLANQLKDSFRWVEAYDAYVAALDHDPANAMALSGIGGLLGWRLGHRANVEGPVRRSVVRYLIRARDSLGRAHDYGGSPGVKRVEELLRQFKVAADASI